MAQQIYAKIKRTSKYYSQNQMAKDRPELWGFPFPVEIIGREYGGYLVQGGPGGQYRLRDVSLYVIEDGREVKIS